jgi:cleavage stimulation factor subunit 3
MVEAWRKYLKWEEGNPLMLEDSKALQARVSFAFKKAASALQFFPELW